MARLPVIAVLLIISTSAYARAGLLGSQFNVVPNITQAITNIFKWNVTLEQSTPVPGESESTVSEAATTPVPPSTGGEEAASTAAPPSTAPEATTSPTQPSAAPAVTETTSTSPAVEPSVVPSQAPAATA